MTRSLQKHAPLRLERPEYEELRQRVLRRDGWRCQFCGSRLSLGVHHQHFRSHSGEDTEKISSLYAGTATRLRMAPHARNKNTCIAASALSCCILYHTFTDFYLPTSSKAFVQLVPPKANEAIVAETSAAPAGTPGIRRATPTIGLEQDIEHRILISDVLY